MDDQSLSAIKMLEAIAECRSRLISLAQRLQFRPEVVRVLDCLECRKYQNSSVIEGYVDVELRSGNALAWWLEINWTVANWLIKSRILINRSEGQDVLKEFSDKTANSLDECIQYMLQAASELNESAESVDLSM